MEPGIGALIKTPLPSIPAAEYNQLAQCLGDHITSLAERFRRELSPLVVFLRRTSTEIADQERALYSLITYAGAAMRADIPLSTFFPRFITYLAPGAHQCECTECRLERPVQPQSAKEDTTPAVPISASYLNPTFKFTQLEKDRLQEAIPAGDTLTTAQFEDLEDYYKRPTGTIRAVLDKLDQWAHAVRAEIDANYERVRLAELDDQVRKAELAAGAGPQPTITPYVWSTEDVRGVAEAQAALSRHVMGVRDAWLAEPGDMRDRNLETEDDKIWKAEMEAKRKEEEFIAEATRRGLFHPGV